MPPRLTFIASASTAAIRAGAFPLDEELDEKGQRDAAARAGSLPSVRAALTSPARCAVETAKLLGFEATIDPALRDLDVGRWAGCSLAGLATSDPEALSGWLSDPGYAPHGGETIEGLFARISIWLAGLSGQNERIVAVTHPAVIRAGILAAIHAGPTSFWNIDIAALTVVELTSNGKRWALKSISN